MVTGFVHVHECAALGPARTDRATLQSRKICLRTAGHSFLFPTPRCPPHSLQIHDSAPLLWDAGGDAVSTTVFYSFTAASSIWACNRCRPWGASRKGLLAIEELQELGERTATTLAVG